MAKHITGSGVLIYGSYNDSICVIGGLNSTSNQYSDFGGSIDKNETPFNAAIRELLEESKNTFIISPSDITKTIYYDIPYTKNKYYRVFPIFINNISKQFIQYFNHNSTALQNYHNSCWHEVSNIKFLNINNLKYASKRLYHCVNYTLHKPKSIYIYNYIDNKLNEKLFLTNTLSVFLFLKEHSTHH
jgi:hypothetical protein